MAVRSAHTWRFVAAAPPREVFAVMEQMLGTWPYRYEVVGPGEARIVEFKRRGLAGQWSTPKRGLRWVRCSAESVPEGTRVEVEASAGGGLLAKMTGRADHGTVTRALQLVRLLSAGSGDPRTLYRDRHIPPGPVTLVASWAGVPYALFTEPRFDAPREGEVLTASQVEALAEREGAFLRVRLGDGTEGWVERDQVVAAPAVATRAAQEDTATHSV